MFRRLGVLAGVLIMALYITGCASMSGGSRMYNGDTRSTRGQSRTVTGAPGQKIVKTAERIALEEKRAVVGSCWDFINAVYNEAGYPENKRVAIFKGSRNGPYANPGELKAGDWVMHINLEFNGVEHSSIFIRWVDRGRKIAKVMDYAGQNKNQPGSYGEHTYSKIFCILRPKEE
jgi:hypothetical protein